MNLLIIGWVILFGIIASACFVNTRGVQVKQIESISIAELIKMSESMYDALVKAVVDVEAGLVVVDAGLHADEELLLLENGSKQENLWGINLWPENYGTDEFIEFDSMINMKPYQNNRSRSVDDPELQKAIRALIEKVVHE
jgi:hypothetical protein